MLLLWGICLMGEKVLRVYCIFYSVIIIPNGRAYVKSFGVALHSRNTLRERGSSLNEDKNATLALPSLPYGCDAV